MINPMSHKRLFLKYDFTYDLVIDINSLSPLRTIVKLRCKFGLMEKVKPTTPCLAVGILNSDAKIANEMWASATSQPNWSTTTSTRDACQCQVVVHIQAAKILTNDFLFDIDRFQGRVSVEQIGDEGHVQFRVALHDIFRRDELPAAEPVSRLQHRFRSGQVARSLEKDKTIGATRTKNDCPCFKALWYFESTF